MNNWLLYLVTALANERRYQELRPKNGYRQSYDKHGES